MLFGRGTALAVSGPAPRPPGRTAPARTSSGAGAGGADQSDSLTPQTAPRLSFEHAARCRTQASWLARGRAAVPLHAHGSARSGSALTCTAPSGNNRGSVLAVACRALSRFGVSNTDTTRPQLFRLYDSNRLQRNIWLMHGAGCNPMPATWRGRAIGSGAVSHPQVVQSALGPTWSRKASGFLSGSGTRFGSIGLLTILALSLASARVSASFLRWEPKYSNIGLGSGVINTSLLKFTESPPHLYMALAMPSAWIRAPSQPLMRSSLSRFQTPTLPRRAVGFFGFGCRSGCPVGLITQLTSDWKSLN